MQLKAYQQQALDRLDSWLAALKEAHLKSEKTEKVLVKEGMDIPEELENYPRAAWESLKGQGILPPDSGRNAIPDYIPRTSASGAPIPHVCMKIPTGGGKTLLGVAALKKLNTKDNGFVLWIVPTKAIYEQTIKAFRTREHPYRQTLEQMSGSRVKLLQKGDRFTKQDVESYLCVMMLMLPSANRQKGKEFLKIFRDSGSYTSFFPQQDDMSANQELMKCHPDLDLVGSRRVVRQSLFNTLKLIRPVVILDEAHKAYGRNNQANKDFVQSVNRLNPRFVLELSATPKIGISNILVNVGGGELKEEEMIKLPIEIRSFKNSNWKHTLAETQKKLKELETAARKLRAKENRYVRPIALVRVQRTGKEQRQQGMIHAEDVRDYLIKRLSVPECQVRIQSSEQKELAGEDLLSEISHVRWVITKDALKEGWDCSFAYILALLDNTTATTAMTQMVGRVMRQPHARTMTPSNSVLNRCYIYCYNEDVNRAVEGVKNGLEQEGLTGLGDAIHRKGTDDESKHKTIGRRKKYKKLRIFLPQVLHKEGKGWRLLDYERDILSALEWNKLNGGPKVKLDDKDNMQQVKITMDVQGQSEISKESLDTGETLTLDYFVRRLADVVPNPWQAARVAESFLRRHGKSGRNDTRLLNNRIYLSEVLLRRVKSDIDRKAEKVFRDKVGENKIHFHLETDEQLNYAIGKYLEVWVSDKEGSLQYEAQAVQHSLFEPVYKRDFNDLEEDFALYLEKSDALHWWHRIAAKQAYSLQGWRRQRVYPDFVACRQDDGTLLILETKGMHLKGNEDTQYKAKLLSTLEKTYEQAIDRGEMKLGEPPLERAPQVVLRMMFEDEWKEKLDPLVGQRK